MGFRRLNGVPSVFSVSSVFFFLALFSFRFLHFPSVPLLSLISFSFSFRFIPFFQFFPCLPCSSVTFPSSSGHVHQWNLKYGWKGTVTTRFALIALVAWQY